jgi:hypothetical protein
MRLRFEGTFYEPAESPELRSAIDKRYRFFLWHRAERANR